MFYFTNFKCCFHHYYILLYLLHIRAAMVAFFYLFFPSFYITEFPFQLIKSLTLGESFSFFKTQKYTRNHFFGFFFVGNILHIGDLTKQYKFLTTYIHFSHNTKSLHIFESEYNFFFLVSHLNIFPFF